MQSPRAVVRPLLVLAGPVFAEGLLNMLVGYTDTFLTARFLRDDEYLAAIGLMAYALWLIPSLFTFVDIGATALVARFTGAGDRGGAEQVLHQAMALGAVLAAAVALALALGGAAFVALLRYSGPSAAYAERYLYLLVPAVPFIMLEQVGTACLRGAGDTVTGFAARVVMNLVNVALSTVLVIGWGPFPKLGWEGIALGTTVAHAVGGSLIFAALLRGRTLRFRWSSLAWNAPLARRILRVGIPGGCDVVGVISCHLAYMGLIRGLGTHAAAAHSLGVQIEAIAYLPGSAFSVAAATLMGQSLGANNIARARHSTWIAMLAAIVVMSATGALLYFGGHSLAALFTESYEHPTGRLTGNLLKVVALSMPFLAILSVLSGALRGAGDTRTTLFITFAGLLGVRLPLAAWFACSQVTIPLVDITIAGWNLGVFGAWYAMVADVVLRSLLALGRFLHGGWQRVRV